MGEAPRNLATPRICGLLAERPTQLSAAMHNAAFQALALPYSYAAFDTSDTAGGLQAMRSLGIRGLSLSIPHKEAAVPLMDRLSEEIEQIGSINTVVNDGSELTGYNTDVMGIVNAFREAGFTGSSGKALLLGSGGAARAGVVAFRRLGISAISIANRTGARAESLCRSMKVVHLPWDEVTRSGEFEILVNATPIGSPLSSDSAAADLLSRLALNKNQIVFDMVTRETPLLRQAKRIGCKTIAGSRMLLYQALEQFQLFTEREAPQQVMETALAQALS